MKLNHLHFSSPALPETCAFYHRYFGFEVRWRILDKVVLSDSEGFILAIDPIPQSEHDQASHASQLRHLGFYLDTPDEVVALHRRMKDDGVDISQELVERSANCLHFYCVDPSGNPIEVGWNRAFVKVGAGGVGKASGDSWQTRKGRH